MSDFEKMEAHRALDKLLEKALQWTQAEDSHTNAIQTTLFEAQKVREAING